MSEKNKLAIVIPYYNYRFFEKTLAALDKQNNSHFNLYIGNDASQNNPEHLINSFKNLPLKKYQYFPENLGGISLIKQWERCIALTEDEEWIVLLGDDDIISENYVASFHEHISEVIQEGIEVIRYASRYIDEEDRIKWDTELYRQPLIEKATDSFYKNHCNLSRSSLSEHVFSRKSYEQYGFYEYPLAWHSDDRAWLEFTNFGELYSINTASVGVRISSSSISGTLAHKNTKMTARVFFYDFIVQAGVLERFTTSQQRKLLIDYCIFCKSVSDFNFRKFYEVYFNLLKMKDFEAMFYVLKIYLK